MNSFTRGLRNRSPLVLIAAAALLAPALLAVETALDLPHLRPAGRAIWQAELARRLARLYDDGTLRTAL